jgi:hypothetical protein
VAREGDMEAEGEIWWLKEVGTTNIGGDDREYERDICRVVRG